MTTRDNFVTQEMMFKWITFLKNIYFHVVDIFLFYIFPFLVADKTSYH